MAEGVVKAMVVLVRVATIAISENLIMAAAIYCVCEQMYRSVGTMKYFQQLSI